jgi:hypothetical protein
MQGDEIEKKTPDRLLEQFKNIDVMEPEDAHELIEKLNIRFDQYDKTHQDNI